jgi:hypothetical protein
LESSAVPETTTEESALESSTPPETTTEESTLESATPPETTTEESTLESATPPETTTEESTLESSTPLETTNEESTEESSTPPETTNEESTVESSTEMSNLCELFDIVRKGDMIYGIYNTTAGQDTGGFNGSFSVPTEEPPFAIDSNLSTKYVNFGTNGGYNAIPGQVGIGTGFFAISSLGSAFVARGIQFATGNDAPNRDPITITLEGSNSTNVNQLQMGSSWTPIYNGVSGISAAVAPNRTTYGVQVTFFNTKAFLSYRLLITSQRGDDIAVQYSEARILGEYILLDVKYTPIIHSIAISEWRLC